MTDPATGVREIVQIAGMANSVIALCGDGTLWVGSFTAQLEGTGFVWRRVSDIPQGDATKFKTID